MDCGRTEAASAAAGRRQHSRMALVMPGYWPLPATGTTAAASARARQIPEQHVEPQPHTQVGSPVVRLVPAHDGFEVQVQPAVLRRPSVKDADFVVLRRAFALERALILAEYANTPANADVVGCDVGAVPVRHDELARPRKNEGLRPLVGALVRAPLGIC